MPDKLSIIPCTLNNSGSVSGTRDGEAFTAMLNPESFKHDKSINYSGMSKSDIKKAGGIPLGASAAMPRFKNTGSEKVSFSLTVDGTGVVPPNSENSGSISGKIKALSQVVYDYKGSSHEPNVEAGVGFFLLLRTADLHVHGLHAFHARRGAVARQGFPQLHRLHEHQGRGTQGEQEFARPDA